MGVTVPQIKLSVGQEDLTPIPAQYLKEFRYTSKLGGWYEVECSLFEPWEFYRRPGFISFENKILAAMGTQETVQQGEFLIPARQIKFRFGFTTYKDEYWTLDLNTALKNYNPTLGEAGVDVALSTICWQAEVLASKTNRYTFTGRASDVVSQICDKFGFKKKIERTDDFRNANRTWSTNTLSIMGFIKKELLRHARSEATGRTDYEVQLLPDNTLVFSPPMSANWHKNPLKFTYLGGRDSVVKSMAPDFKSDMLGAWGAGGNLKRIYNPYDQQYEQVILNPSEHNNKFALGGETNIPPREVADGIVTGGVSDPDPDAARIEAIRDWQMLSRSVSEAQMEMYGNERTLRLEGGDVIYAAVQMPDGSEHWASGYWLIKEAVHQISGNYSVTLQLQRDYSRIRELQGYSIPSGDVTVDGLNIYLNDSGNEGEDVDQSWEDYWADLVQQEEES